MSSERMLVNSFTISSRFGADLETFAPLPCTTQDIDTRRSKLALETWYIRHLFKHFIFLSNFGAAQRKVDTSVFTIFFV